MTPAVIGKSGKLRPNENENENKIKYIINPLNYTSKLKVSIRIIEISPKY